MVFRAIVQLAIIAMLTASVGFAAGPLEIFKYDPHGKRDPFVPLVGQEKNTIGNLSDITSPEDLKLEGIAVGSEGKKTAIINGEIVKVGQKIGEVEVKNITAKTVELLVAKQPYTLNLSEEGGSKSE
jgi:hypothetical protein